MIEMSFEDGEPIEGYGPGFFRLGGEVHQGGLAVLPGVRLAWGGYDDLQQILDASDKIDVLFVGTGSEITPIPKVMRLELESAGVGVEIMSSPTACRTYNIVLSEGRRIGLAVLPV